MDKIGGIYSISTTQFAEHLSLWEIG